MFPVAKHILSLVIDERLRAGDISLVSEIQRVTINNVEKNFYSFVTKYIDQFLKSDEEQKKERIRKHNITR